MKRIQLSVGFAAILVSVATQATEAATQTTEIPPGEDGAASRRQLTRRERQGWRWARQAAEERTTVPSPVALPAALDALSLRGCDRLFLDGGSNVRACSLPAHGSRASLTPSVWFRWPRR